jgi:hypothetical protein
MPSFSERAPETAEDVESGVYEEMFQKEAHKYDQEMIAEFKRELKWNLGEARFWLWPVAYHLLPGACFVCRSMRGRDSAGAGLPRVVCR